MELATRSLVGALVQAENEVVGKVDDVFFDVRTGHVTHLSVALTGWSRGTIVLVGVDACRVRYSDGKVFFSDMTPEDVRNEPFLDDEAAWNSRAAELLATYQDTAPCWSFSGRCCVTATRSESIEKKTGQDALWGSRDLAKAVVSLGKEKRLGRVEDLVLDSDTWRMTHLIVRQGPWYRRSRISIPVDRVVEVEKDARAVRLNLLPAPASRFVA